MPAALQMLSTPRTKSRSVPVDYEALFNSFDADGSGEIDYNEMAKHLRRVLPRWTLAA